MSQWSGHGPCLFPQPSCHHSQIHSLLASLSSPAPGHHAPLLSYSAGTVLLMFSFTLLCSHFLESLLYRGILRLYFRTVSFPQSPKASFSVDVAWTFPYLSTYSKTQFNCVCVCVCVCVSRGKSKRKKFTHQTSLAVQRLRLWASSAGGAGSIPGQGTKIPQAALCSQKKKEKYLTHPSKALLTIQEFLSLQKSSA